MSLDHLINLWESTTLMYVMTHSDRNRVGRDGSVMVIKTDSSKLMLHKSTPTKLYCFDFSGNVALVKSKIGLWSNLNKSGVDLIIVHLLLTVSG